MALKKFVPVKINKRLFEPFCVWILKKGLTRKFAHVCIVLLNEFLLLLLLLPLLLFFLSFFFKMILLYTVYMFGKCTVRLLIVEDSLLQVFGCCFFLLVLCICWVLLVFSLFFLIVFSARFYFKSPQSFHLYNNSLTRPPRGGRSSNVKRTFPQRGLRSPQRRGRVGDGRGGSGGCWGGGEDSPEEEGRAE